MRDFFLGLLFVFVYNITFAQQSEGDITTYINTNIRLKPTLPARTADAFDVLNISTPKLVGSYSNPSWITSLSGSKITGLTNNNFAFGKGLSGIGISSITYTGNDNGVVIMTQSPPIIIDPGNLMNNVQIFGEGINLNANPSEGGTITDTGIFGGGHHIGDGINYFSGSSSLIYGANNFLYGNSGIVGGQNAELKHSGELSGGLFSTGGISIGLTFASTDATKHVLAYANAVNISANTSMQTSGQGALAPLSGILLGKNNHIPSTSEGSVIIGGNNIIARSSDPYQTYVQNFNIASTPLNDNSLIQLMVRDAINGQIKYKTVASLSSDFQPLDSDLTAIAALTPSNNDFIQRKSGVWTNRSVSQVRTDLDALYLGLSNTRNPVSNETTSLNLDYDFSIEQQLLIRTYQVGDPTNSLGFDLNTNNGSNYARLYSASSDGSVGYFNIESPQSLQIKASNTTNTIIADINQNLFKITGTGSNNLLQTTGFKVGTMSFSGSGSGFSVTVDGSGGTINPLILQVQNTSTISPLIALLTPSNQGIRLFGNGSTAGNIIKAVNSTGDSQWGSLDLSLSAGVGSSILRLINGGFGVALSDPNANKIPGWDDTDNSFSFWTLNTPFSYDHSSHALGISDGVADGATKGIVSFNSNYFDSSSGIITIDPTNGLASASQVGYVGTGSQTFSGIKTFSSSPILPTPSAGDNSTKGATTAYVDFTSLSTNANVYYTSKSGATSDADLSEGSSTFGTDDRTALQALLNLAISNPITIIWDGKYSTSGTLTVYSNTTIYFTSGNGIIMRNSINADIFKNANPTGSTTHTDHDIYFLGTDYIINHNGANQSSHDTTTDGWLTPIRFSGVDHVIIQGANILSHRTFGIWLMNCTYWEVSNCLIDYTPAHSFGATQTDGLHVNGPSSFGVIKNNRFRTGDNPIALNADDIFQNTTPGGIDACGHPNYDPIGTNGIISDILAENNTILDGTNSGVRLLSAASAITRVSFYKTTFKSLANSYNIIVDNFPNQCLPTGNGNFSDILFDGIDISTDNSLTGSGSIFLGGNIKNITFKNIVAMNYATVTGVMFNCKQNLFAENIDIEGITITNGVASDFVFRGGGYINHLKISDVSMTGQTQYTTLDGFPLVSLNNTYGGRIRTLSLDNIYMEWIRYVVNNTSGEINFIQANNIRHRSGSGTFFIPSGKTVQDIVMDGYSGNVPIEGTGTYNSLRGTGFINLPVGQNNQSAIFDFTGSNGTSLSGYTEGTGNQTWTVQNSSAWQIQNGAAIPNTSSPPSNLWVATVPVNPSTGTVTVSTRVKILSSTAVAQIYLGFLDMNNYIVVNISPTLGNCSIKDNVAGTQTTFGSFTVTPSDFLDNSFHTIRVVTSGPGIGNVLTVFMDEKQIASGTVSSSNVSNKTFGLGTTGSSSPTLFAFDLFLIEWTGLYSAINGTTAITVGSDIILPGVGTNRTPAMKRISTVDNIAELAVRPYLGSTVGSTLSIMPIGAPTNRGTLNLYNTDFVANSTNFENLFFTGTSTEYQIQSVKGGTGTVRPLRWYMGGTQVISLETTGSLKQLGPVYIGNVSTSPTALLHLNAGSTSQAPLRLTSGPLTTGGNILSGNIEFLTDKFYGTISTGPAQKEFTMNDASLTSGFIPIATTNGRLTNWADPTAGLLAGSGSISADAILEAKSTAKGFRPPLMTTTQRNAISSPTDGLIISNSTAHTIDWYNGTSWQSLGTGGSGIGGTTGSIDNALLRADGTGGSTVQASDISISDTGDIIMGLSTTSATTRTLSVDGSGSNIALALSTKGNASFVFSTNGANYIMSNTSFGSLSSDIIYFADDVIFNGQTSAKLNTADKSSGTTGAVTIATGDGVAGNTGTGDISIATGVPSGTGTRGTVKIKGTVTNTSAAAGDVGEEIVSSVSTYTNYTTSATYQNITSITLTAGDWDLSAAGTIFGNSATMTAGEFEFVISTTTASSTGAVNGRDFAYGTVGGISILHDSRAFATQRISLSSSTTYYLNTKVSFSAGNPQFTGFIRARRIR